MSPNDGVLGAGIRLTAIIVAITSAIVLFTVVDRGKAVDQTANRL
jgi:hypothetical protein